MFIPMTYCRYCGKKNRTDMTKLDGDMYLVMTKCESITADSLVDDVLFHHIEGMELSEKQFSHLEIENVLSDVGKEPSFYKAIFKVEDVKKHAPE
jgi:hypothetical protein